MASTNGHQPLEVHLSAADMAQLEEWTEAARLQEPGRTVAEVAAGVLHGGIIELNRRFDASKARAKAARR